MAWFSVVVGLVLAVMILGTVTKVKSNVLQGLIGLAALAVLGCGILFGSVHFVPSNRVGIVKRNLFGSKMAPGQVVAKEGEVGTQGLVLTPGWHFGYWPGIFDVYNVSLISIGDNEVGLVKAVDGRPLEAGQVFAEELSPARFKELLDNPLKFLGENGGQKGPQTTVLRPGDYRINTSLFNITKVPQTDVKAGTVAVLKSNVGTDPTLEFAGKGEGSEIIFLAREGEKGVRAASLSPGKYPINPRA